MKHLNAKSVKLGEEYFYPDTHFTYSKLFDTYISKAKVYRIADGQYSSRNDGDRYEVMRVIAYKNETDAKKYLVKRIKERLKQIKKEAEFAITQLTHND
jgi:hypothetical protein